MKSASRSLLTAVLLSIASSFFTYSYAGVEHNYQFTQKSYNGSQTRDYTVYEPPGFSGPLPMVMVLHGCQQTESDVLTDWGMKAAADQYGFLLVTPFITTYNGLRNTNCWGFWFQEHRHEGSGEVEDLHQIGLEVESNFSIDPDRRFITGLSSGGAMVVDAAVAHNEYWAAAASASGLPYGEDSSSVSLSGSCPGSAIFHSVGRVVSDMVMEINNDYPIPMMVLQNENDCTVVQPAGRNIRDAHLKAFGTVNFNTPTETLADTQNCNPFYQNNYTCKHDYFTQDGTTSSRSIVETVFFNGPLDTANNQDTNHGHYWVAGQNGNEGKWAVRQGPEYPEIIWDFFSRHPRGNSAPVNKPVITINGDNPLNLNLNGVFSDPGATAIDIEDGTVPVNSNCTVNTSVDGTYSCTYSAIDLDDNISTAIRSVIVTDPNKPQQTCIAEVSPPLTHINANRANAGGSNNLRAISTGDQADIGFAWDSWSNVELTEGEPGIWYAQKPENCQTTLPPSFECKQWNTSNFFHQIAGRAYYSFGYYSAGGNDYLGAFSSGDVWVAETSAGMFVAGQCP